MRVLGFLESFTYNCSIKLITAIKLGHWKIPAEENVCAAEFHLQDSKVMQSFGDIHCTNGFGRCVQ